MQIIKIYVRRVRRCDRLSQFITHRSEIRMHFLYFDKYSSMPLAAALPAPMARITVAAPVTASPPA